MSCITKILEKKDDMKIIVSGEIAIEGGGTYQGYEYLITFTAHGHRCGYVAIPENHKLHSYHNEDYNYHDLEVHGGVTFFGAPRFAEHLSGQKCTDKWIGFDAAHCYDHEDIETVEKYFGETKWVKYRKENPMIKFDGYSEHRTYSYMESQCKRLINQLIDK
jgi:hypothetical protein